MRSLPRGWTTPRLFFGFLCLAVLAGAFARPAALSGAPDPAPHRWALLIGVSNYQDREIAGPITGAADSRELAAALGKAGWDHVVRLAGDVSKREVEAARAARLQLAPVKEIPEGDTLQAADLRPTRAHVSAWIEALLAREGGPRAGDTLLVAFSGRAAVAADGAACLLARDTRMADPAGTGILVSALRDRLAASPASTKVLVLDACRPGDPGRDGRDPAQALLDDSRSPELLVLSACAGGQASYPVEAPGQAGAAGSAFAHSLAQGLRGKADADRSGTVTALELREYVSAQVGACSRGRQTPVMEGGADDLTLARAVEAPQKAPARLGLIAGGIAALGGLVAALGGGGGGGGGTTPAPAAIVRGYVFQSSARAFRMPGRQTGGYLILRAGATPPEASAPAARATVTASTGGSTTTSASGAFALGVDEAQCTLTASLAGYDSVSATIDPETDDGQGAKPPMVVSAWAVDATHVDVAFSELVDPASATNTGSYTATPALAVLSARLQPNGTTVRLATGEQNRGTLYTVTAIGVSDGKGHAIQPPGSGAAFTGEGDAPQVVVATAPDDTHADVVFNEAVDPQTAAAAGNYSITPALAVGAAALQNDGKTVRLATAPQSAGVSYTVAVAGVRDLAGNLIGTTNQMATFAGKGVAPQVVSGLVVDSTHWDVLFSEAVDSSTANASGSYAISPALAVTAAEVQADGRTVRLAIAEPRDGTVYTLVAGGVTDLAGDGVAGPNDRVSLTGRGVPPQVVSASSPDTTHVAIHFNEALQGASVPLLSNYTVSPALVVQEAVLQSDGQTVLLTTAAQIPGTAYTVTVASVTDVAANPVGTDHNSATFTGQSAEPRVVSATAADSTSVEVTFSAAMDAASLGGYSISAGGGGAAVTVSASSVAAEGKTVRLTTTEHTGGVTYTVTVAQGKDRLGTALASDAKSAAYTGVGVPPQVLSASATDPTHVVVTFNEVLDQASAEAAANYAISSDLAVTGAALRTGGQSVLLTTAAQQTGTTYTVAVAGVKDRALNPVVTPTNSTQFVGSSGTAVRNGRIVFKDYGFALHPRGLYAVNPDGSALTQLTGDADAPVFSPDGRKIVYEVVSDIWAMNVDGTAAMLLASTGRLDSHPTWSPDGAKIAFCLRSSSVDDIWVMNADGTGQTRLTSTPAGSPGAQCPVWSPDGSPIAYVSGSELNVPAPGSVHIYVMATNGTGQRRLIQGTTTSSEYNPSWSPDGARVAFRYWDASGYYIAVANADGSNLALLTPNPLGQGAQATIAWSPDGTRILFDERDSTMTQGEDHIWVMNADGTGRVRLTSLDAPGRYNSAPCWSPDGSAIVWQTLVGGGYYDLWVANADGSNPQKIGTGAHPQWGPAVPEITISPRVAGAVSRHPFKALVAFDVALSKATAETAANYTITPSLKVTSAALQTDGKSVLVTTWEQQDGQQYTVVVTGVKDASGNVVASPVNSATFTGRGTPPGVGLLAFASSGIWTVYGDGSWLTRLSAVGGEYPVWSPDGSRIAFARESNHNYDVWLINVDGSGETNLTQNAAIDDHPSWSADGTKIAFRSNRDGPFAVYVMNADGSGQTRLVSGTTNSTDPFATTYRPVWSPDGSKIAYLGSGLCVMDPDGSNQKRLCDGGAAVAWSPDSTKLAFDGVYTVNADGTGLKRVTTTGSWPAWSPDGTKLAFCVRSPRYALATAPADGNAVTPTLTEGSMYLEERPAWSADGQYIAWGNRYSVSRVNADGTGVQAITPTGYVYSVAWRPSPSARAAALSRAARGAHTARLRAQCAGMDAEARLTLQGLVTDGRAAGLRFVPLEGALAGLRSPVSGRSWSFALDGAAQGDEVTLSWPDLSGLGSKERLVLEDLDAGIRRSMRTTAAYTFRAGEGARRRFRVAVEARTGPAVAITGLELAGAGGGRGRLARFTLSTDATVDLDILDPAGRVIAVIARSRACTSGLNQVGWAAPLPHGLCLLRATATTEEGTTVRALRPVMSVR